MPGVKGMKRTGPPPATAFKPGHTVQPAPEQRASGIIRAKRTQIATSFRAAVADGIGPDDPIAWLHKAVEIAARTDDAKALLQAAELTWLYTIGKPREQLSKREGINMLTVIEQAAAEMRERTIEGVVVVEREREEDDEEEEEEDEDQP